MWEFPTTGDGLGGVAATAEIVVIGDRDPRDSADIWRCIDAELGFELWQVTYPAAGRLDYGNSPRATPLIDDDLVYLVGAFGHVYCVQISTGEVVWKKDLVADFGGEVPIWGWSASPLIVDGRLILNPGGNQALLVALEPSTGKTLWTSPPAAAAYASFVAATIDGRTQLIGYDKHSLGAWDAADGRRLWQIPFSEGADFNVPTPIVLGDRLLTTSENHGTRLFRLRASAPPELLARYRKLSPDTSTPVIIDDRVFGVWQGLHCFAMDDELTPLWTARDRAFNDYASLIAAPGRVLITTTGGELILIDSRAAAYTELGRVRIGDDGVEVPSHPALVGTKLYVRSTKTLACLELGESAA